MFVCENANFAAFTRNRANPYTQVVIPQGTLSLAIVSPSSTESLTISVGVVRGFGVSVSGVGVEISIPAVNKGEIVNVLV